MPFSSFLTVAISNVLGFGEISLRSTEIWVRFIKISSRSVGIWTRFGEISFAVASLSFDWKWLNQSEESFNPTLWCSRLVVGPLSYHPLKSIWAWVEFKPNLDRHMDNPTCNSILLRCAFNVTCCRKSLRQSQTNLWSIQVFLKTWFSLIWF